jgi:hypothetical protein
MRDFRDAKAMAQTLRAALAAAGFKISVGQSLELIAKAFGAADWNTLSAAINADGAAPPSPPAAPSPVAETPSAPGRVGFSDEIASTLHRAITAAKQRSHEYATLEHLLLALVDDKDASAVMQACNVDLDELRRELSGYLENDVNELKRQASDDAKPTAGFQRVIQRAVIHVRAGGGQSVTGANVLVAIFSEQESRAAHLLAEQAMTRIDAVNFIAHGAVKRGGDAAA